MTSNENVVFGVLAGAAVVVPLALGLGQGWPAWVVIALVFALLGGVTLARYRLRRWPEQGELDTEVILPPQREASLTGETVRDVPLDSDTEDYRFLFSATVYWRPVPGASRVPHADPGALAVEAVLDRAAAITRTAAPHDHVLVQHRLAAALGSEQPVGDGHLIAWAKDIRVTVPEEDSERLRTLAELRKKISVWEHERGHERSVREYLGQEVLTSTGAALVWWLARHLDKVEQAADLIGTLHRLSEVAQDRVDPGPVRLISQAGQPAAAVSEEYLERLVPGVVEGESAAPPDRIGEWFDFLFPNPDDDRRFMFAERQASLLVEFNLDEAAQQVRERIGVWDVTEDPADSADSGYPNEETSSAD